MTQTEKVSYTRVIGNMTDTVRFKDDMILAFLDLAGDSILQRMFPFGYEDDAEIPAKYHRMQCKIAVYLINRKGSEGETYHSENGINRTYASADVPADMLKGIVPMCKVLK